MTKLHRPSKMRFNCYLLRTGLATPEDALRTKYRASGAEALTKIEGLSGAPARSVAYLGSGKDRIPRWAQEMNEYFPGTDAAVNRSNRLVIFIPVGARWFAVCFGYGSSALEWDAVESNFGLRVAARKLRPKEVMELRSRRIDASARTQSVQVLQGVDLRELGVNLDGEFVRKLTGRLDAGGIDDLEGAIVAGDSIAFKAETNLNDVQKYLNTMLKTVIETEAQEEFEFIDSLEPLRSNEGFAKKLDNLLALSLIERLDEKARPELMDLSFQLLQFAIPDGLDVDQIETVQVRYRNLEATIQQFDLTSLRAILAVFNVGKNASYLKDVKMVAIGPDGSEVSQMLPLRNWLVFEVSDGASRFILTLGKWFRLSGKFQDKLNRDLGRIQDLSSALALPDSTRTEWERDYNARAARLRPDLLLMDRVLVATEDGDRIEACDLFSDQGHLIHVKRYTGSQTSSHLLSQGAVSAELLIGDAVTKSDFLDKVRNLDSHFAAAAQDAPQIVVYAIVLEDEVSLPLDLPSFMKVNLRDFAKRLRRMSVTPAIARIRIS